MAIYLMKIRQENNSDGGKLGTNIISCINSSPYTNESKTKSETTERKKGRADLKIIRDILIILPRVT